MARRTQTRTEAPEETGQPSFRIDRIRIARDNDGGIGYAYVDVGPFRILASLYIDGDVRISRDLRDDDLRFAIECAVRTAVLARLREQWAGVEADA